MWHYLNYKCFVSLPQCHPFVEGRLHYTHLDLSPHCWSPSIRLQHCPLQELCAQVLGRDCASLQVQSCYALFSDFCANSSDCALWRSAHSCPPSSATCAADRYSNVPLLNAALLNVALLRLGLQSAFLGALSILCQHRAVTNAHASLSTLLLNTCVTLPGHCIQASTLTLLCCSLHNVFWSQCCCVQLTVGQVA